MFWDGERWLPDDGQPIARPQLRSRRRFRNSISVGIMALVLVGLTLPMTGVVASTSSARTLLSTWSTGSKVAVYQESSRQISYHGRWATARNPSYLGGKARAARAGKASATLKFSGAAVSWVGPIGPTRGKAKVYIDGKLVKTVNTWASHFRPTRVLFQKSWSTAGAHAIKIVTLGTAHHPTVALDAFLVRLDTGANIVSAPTPTPKVAPTPTPKVAPTPTPKVAPTPTPKVAQTQGLKVVGLTPTVTATQFVAAVRDNTTDVIELAGGTYRLGVITLNVDRTRPLVIRPAAGATVVFAGGSQSAFWIGAGGVAGRITIEGLVFDGFTLSTNGIIWLGNCHDITINNIVVRNSTGQAGYSWSLYLSTDGGVSPRNVVANNWTVDGGARTVGGLQIAHTPGAQSVTATGWHVTNASYAIYSGGPASGVNISDWTIDSSGLSNLSVDLVNTAGSIRNVHATNSGSPEILAPMVDAGGNTWR